MAKEGNKRETERGYAKTALKFTGFGGLCLPIPINASKTQYI
ncbi:MAG: hypothetical protein SOU50_08505 [Oscillospiraceae bacterium]|nr:hypothetical protein [Oscillospiraceae bacterium]MDY2848241.1 hypothetical protein [Oscillospiraceae bacterium]